MRAGATVVRLTAYGVGNYESSEKIAPSVEGALIKAGAAALAAEQP